MKVHVQDLYTEFKTLLRDIKDLNEYRNTSCLWIRTLNIIKMSTLPRLIYRLNNLSRFRGFVCLVCFILVELTSRLKSKNKFGGLALPEFKSYCKAVIIKTL